MLTGNYVPWIIAAAERGVPGWVLGLVIKAEAEAIDDDQGYELIDQVLCQVCSHRLQLHAYGAI